MGLFNPASMAKINQCAEKSKEILAPKPKVKAPKGLKVELDRISKIVLEYYKDSPAILITNVEDLHNYIDEAIKVGYVGIDIETTGLDIINDTMVGFSLYYPGGVECYVPINHIVPIFEEPYKNQLSYEDTGKELQRLVDAKVKLIFANANFDIPFIYKDTKCDVLPAFYYDVILAWRCLKEDEKDNSLKALYHKYPNKGEGDPKKFSDLFTAQLFPFCKPEIAKYYAANDARITYDLFTWQLPFILVDNELCKKNKLESVANLIWNVEFPLVAVCEQLHRQGFYIEKSVAKMLQDKYNPKYQAELQKLYDMVQEIMDTPKYASSKKRPFNKATDFNPDSNIHVKYLIYEMLKLDAGRDNGKTGKDVLKMFNLPVTQQILDCRSLRTVISTFIEKLPNITTKDGKIHGRIKQIGANTGRMSSADPNLQNIPSRRKDIRHMFRADPAIFEFVKVADNDELTVLTLAPWDSLCVDDNCIKVWKYIDEIEVGSKIYEQQTDDEPSLVFVSSRLNEHQLNVALQSTKGVQDAPKRIEVKRSPYVLMSSDFSQQEPKLTAFISRDEKMIQAFKDNKDIYSTIASIAFGVPYEDCKEFNAQGEYSPDGNKRRNEAKSVLLGINYGRSVKTVGEQLYGSEPISDEERNKKAQKVFDAVLMAFPGLRGLMNNTQNSAKQLGYVETILGRRRHIPDMQLPDFEFHALPGYENPDIDPLDTNTLTTKETIPQRIIDALEKEFKSLKYFGQINKRIKELKEKYHIRAVNNRFKISEASRQCVNSAVQGSAADLTKLAMLRIHESEEWHALGGQMIIPVHDEIIAQVPIRNAQLGAEVLSKSMCDAADFLPFNIECDVTITYRWYGLDYPCKYPQPDADKPLQDYTEDEIRWMQYHLFECGYVLPKIKQSEDEKIYGDAALGINGIVSDEYSKAIVDYIGKYRLTFETVINHIATKVHEGMLIQN